MVGLGVKMNAGYVSDTYGCHGRIADHYWVSTRLALGHITTKTLFEFVVDFRLST